MPAVPKWSSYVVLGGTALGAIFEFIALIIFGRLLIKSMPKKFRLRTVIEVCPSMILYIMAEVLTCSAVCFHLCYIAIFWHYDSNKYDGYLLYISGSLQSTLNMTKPVAVFCLGLDRVCCFLWPFSFVKTRRIYPILGCCIPIAIIFFISFTFRIIPNWPINSSTSCSTYGCMTSAASGEMYYLERFIASGANMFIGICLIILIAKKLQTTSNVRVHSNRLVLTTVCLTLVLDLMPHIVSTVGVQIFQVNPVIYIGPYSSICGALESFFCAIIYRRAFNRMKKTINSTSRTIQIKSIQHN